MKQNISKNIFIFDQLDFAWPTIEVASKFGEYKTFRHETCCFENVILSKISEDKLLQCQKIRDKLSESGFKNVSPRVFKINQLYINSYRTSL
jgi:hypothetical protein